MYLQDIVRSRAASGARAKTTAGANASQKRDVTLRIGVSLLIASGAVLGIINLLVMIRLVAVALGA